MKRALLSFSLALAAVFAPNTPYRVDVAATQRVWAAMQSDKQEAKWRDHFKKLGPETVRDKLHAGVYWRTRQGAAAERWLREQEAAEDSANKWVHAATVAGLVIAFFSLLMMFG